MGYLYRGIDMRLSEENALDYKQDSNMSNYEGNMNHFINNVNNFIAMIELHKDFSFGRFLEVSDKLCKEFNYPRKEMLKMTPYDLKEIEDNVIKGIEKEIMTKDYIGSDVICFYKKDMEYPVEIVYNIFNLDEGRLVVILTDNISPNMEVKGCPESKERYEKLVELLPDAVHVKYKGKIVFSNEAGAKLFGFKNKEEIIGIHDKEITHPKYLQISINRGNKMRKEKNSAPSMEQKCIRADGQIIDVEVVSTPIKFDKDYAILSVIRDITERKKWESMLNETLKDNRILLAKAIELDKQRTEFFSNISHEFKTPLNVILGSIQLLENFEIDTELRKNYPRISKYTGIMKQNCYRLLRLINNLIDINKADSKFLEANLSNYDIIRIVEDVTLSVADFGKNKGLSVIFDTEVEEKVISCDADKIERIMLNLLSNSIKYTEPGGNVYVNIYDKGEKIIISVKDSGIGIPKDKLKIIFERFEQIDSSLRRKKEGSGIGLSLVKSFVEVHKGKIWVESELGVGTQFLIELPAKKAAEKNVKYNYSDYSPNLVERINIEFSDIYS